MWNLKNSKDNNIQRFLLDQELTDQFTDIKNDLNYLTSGSFADVYTFKNEYVLKTMKYNFLGFLDDIPEIIILNNYKNLNIIDSKGFIIYECKLSLILEKADRSLEDFIFNSDDVRKKAINDITNGLNHLHRNLFLHLDLKQSNILVKCSGELPLFMISDFSLSRKTFNLEINSCNHLISPFYRPYENLKGSFKYSERSDLWSLGIIIYEISTGIKFENRIMNINVDSLTNIEMSIIVHIEKMMAWGSWPPEFEGNNFLNIRDNVKEIKEIKRVISSFDLSNFGIYEYAFFQNEIEILYQKIILSNNDIQGLDCYIFCFIIILSLHGLIKKYISLINSKLNPKITEFLDNKMQILDSINFEIG